MTQEEFEAKVQSMPQQLRESFRQSLEMSLSSKIVNKFMNVVMSAYAQGQRDAQKDSHDGAYMRGAQDMKDALSIVSGMTKETARKYIPFEISSLCDPIYTVLKMSSCETVFNAVRAYNSDMDKAKQEREKSSVKAMAAEIGIDKLLQLAGEIKNETADGLPF